VNAAREITLSVVLVTYNDREIAAAAAADLSRQLREGDELVVLDNASSDGTAEAVGRAAPAARVIKSATNTGFAAGCNRAAAVAGGELLLFVNPDVRPEPDFCEAIRRPIEGGFGWAAWQGVLTEGGGRTVNTAGNVIHFTGISWTGMSGEPVEAVPSEPREVGVVSGACLAIPRTQWMAHGGFAERFFMYCEDVDLSLRLRLAGGVLGVEPSARVEHLYDFDKGRVPKWELLERNRWSAVLRTYPTRLLLLVLPALLVAELALVAVAFRAGWGKQKLRAVAATVRGFTGTLAERRVIQATRTVAAADFARALTADLSSPYLGAAGRSGAVRVALRLYWSLVRAGLGRG
jgi:GT2 family glycosyltransferase